MGKVSVLETFENLHILTRLSAREQFTEFFFEQFSVLWVEGSILRDLSVTLPRAVAWGGNYQVARSTRPVSYAIASQAVT
jgi:hypothetical protein